MVPPPPDQNHIGAPGCDARRKGVFLAACPGSLNSGGTVPASDPRPWPDQPSLLSEDREVGGPGWWWGYLFGCTVFRERLNRVWTPARGLRHLPRCSRWRPPVFCEHSPWPHRAGFESPAVLSVDVALASPCLSLAFCETGE